MERTGKKREGMKRQKGKERKGNQWKEKESGRYFIAYFHFIFCSLI